ncbi:MAG: exonuclease subunit SbcD [Saprospiraceae bacterium]
MKILHTADWHLGKKLEGFYRLEEQKDVLDEIISIANNNKVDAVLIAGDIYDTYNPPTEAIELFYKTIRKLSRNGKVPVIAIAGNHDSPDRIEAPEPLAVQNGIFFIGYPDTKINLIKTDSGIEVTKSDHGFAEFKIPNNDEKLRIIFSAFANEYRLKKALSTDNNIMEFNQILLDNWNSLAEKYCDNNGINILLSHLFFTSKFHKTIESSEEEKPIVYVGGTQSIDIDSIPMNIQYTALGHLHRFQFIGEQEKNVVYSGSPLSYSFAEANQQKYVVLLDINAEKINTLEKIELKSGKSLLRVKFDNIDDAIIWLTENQNSLVELTIKTENYISSEDRKKLNNAHAGIVYINPEITKEGNTINDNIDIDLDQDIESLFRQYFNEKKNQDINDDLIGIFREIISKDI